MLAQESWVPPAPSARVICTSGVSGPRPATWPSRCQLRPPLTLVRKRAFVDFTPPLGSVWAAQSCPAAFIVANTGLALLSTVLQCVPPSLLSSTLPGHLGRDRS